MSDSLKGRFVSIVLQNPINRAILERLPGLGLPDAWLVSGCLFQSVWNAETGRAIGHGIKDYDIFYFDDSDLSYEAEDAVIKHCERLFSDLEAEIEVRNQARVHLWYEKRFGLPYASLESSCDGIDRFLHRTSMVGIQPREDGTFDVYAPHGLDLVFDMVVVPNDGTPHFSEARFLDKLERWRSCWPELTVRS